MVGPFDELLPLRGQGDAVVPPVQQQVPKAVLQIVNDLPQIGLGDKEGLGGLVDGTQLGNFQKILQMLDIEIATHLTAPPLMCLNTLPRFGSIIAVLLKNFKAPLVLIGIITNSNCYEGRRKGAARPARSGECALHFLRTALAEGDNNQTRPHLSPLPAGNSYEKGRFSL